MEREMQEIWERAARLDDRSRLIVWLECLRYDKEENKFIDFWDVLLHTSSLNWSERYFLYWQAVGRMFTKIDVCTEAVVSKRMQVYYSITEEFQREFTDLRFLPKRNSQIVLVTTQQFLSLNHAPTKIVLDRAFLLAKKKKRVIIINTAEMYGGQFEGAGNITEANYNHELSKCECIEYKGIRFPYMQFEQGMPDRESARVFYAYIEKLKPSYVVNIGGDSLLLDGCARMVPVLNINTVASDIACTQATRQVIGRPVSECDIRFLNCMGKTSENVIVGRFTSTTTRQENHYARKELGLPEQAFLIAVVGTRLTEEIDDNFIDMLGKAFDQGSILVVIGRMDHYEALCGRRQDFREHSIFLGMQPDLPAVLELCDLYVNPRRTGGGTSAIDALMKGIPVVTLREGDVFLGAGEDFGVDSYAGMSDQIIRYMSDIAYYNEMSEKAKARAAYMLDTESAFTEIIREFEKQVL